VAAGSEGSEGAATASQSLPRYLKGATSLFFFVGVGVGKTKSFVLIVLSLAKKEQGDISLHSTKKAKLQRTSALIKIPKQGICVR